MASQKELSDFLIAVERKAYKHAYFTILNVDVALDVVQESMLKLTASYAQKPAEELPLLFQKILQNCIYDHFRKEKSRRQVMVNYSDLSDEEEDGGFSIIDSIESPDEGMLKQTGERRVLQEETMRLIEEELKKLPLRQRQAFLLRYWEEMDINETATVMGCSAGSVKTHCSRAATSLAKALAKKGLSL